MAFAPVYSGKVIDVFSTTHMQFGAEIIAKKDVSILIVDQDKKTVSIQFGKSSWSNVVVTDISRVVTGEHDEKDIEPFEDLNRFLGYMASKLV